MPLGKVFKDQYLVEYSTVCAVVMTTTDQLYLFFTQVWFQNRRSKERRMKQLSALGARRHVLFRSARRMRALGERVEPAELMMPNGHFPYYGGEINLTVTEMKVCKSFFLCL